MARPASLEQQVPAAQPEPLESHPKLGHGDLDDLADVLGVFEDELSVHEACDAYAKFIAEASQMRAPERFFGATHHQVS